MVFDLKCVLVTFLTGRIVSLLHHWVVQLSVCPFLFSFFSQNFKVIINKQV